MATPIILPPEHTLLARHWVVSASSGTRHYTGEGIDTDDPTIRQPTSRRTACGRTLDVAAAYYGTNTRDQACAVCVRHLRAARNKRDDA